MKIKIKRFDKTLPLPSYKSKGAVCVDLYTRSETKIGPGQISYIPLNIATEIPENCWVMIAPRGSTHKLGIMQANSIGIIDVDFCGDNDEYVFPAYNFTQQEITIEKGTRIAQLMIMKFEPIEFEEVDHLNNTDRGKLGSTGQK